jgi:tRNA 2-thiouridine synthesizing protein A
MKELDMTGTYCPEPMMMTQKALREMKDGERIKVYATDSSTTRDFAAFCRFLKHQLIEENIEEIIENDIKKTIYTFIIEKGER